MRAAAESHSLRALIYIVAHDIHLLFRLSSNLITQVESLLLDPFGPTVVLDEVASLQPCHV